MNGNKPVSIYYQNVNELRTKFNQLIQAINVCIHKIIILTETNLASDYATSVFKITPFLEEIDECYHQ